MITLPPPRITFPDILAYLPQRYPMVMVDAYYGIIDDVAYTSLHITKENILIDGGVFSFAGMIDFLAQSGIVEMGDMSVITDFVKESKVGIISHFKKFKLFDTAKIGDTIYGTVRNIFANESMAHLDVAAYCKDKLLIEGIINVMIINNK